MRFHRSSWCSALLASSIMLTFPAVVLGQASQDSAAVDPAARAAFEAGRDAYDRGRFSEALQHFDRAYALSPNPILLYNIGRAAEQDLQNERAVQAYEAYLNALERAENREFVEARLAKLRQVARQSSASTPASAASPTYPSPTPAPYVSPSTVEPVATTKSIPGFRLYAGYSLGTGGEIELDPDEDEYDSYKFDLASTHGIQVGAGYAWRFFGIGAELRTSWLMPESTDEDEEDNGKREKVIDVVVKPRGGYQLREIPLEFYGALPVGLSIPRFEEGEGNERVDVHAGATVGFVAGVSYFFTEHLGVNAELGWLLHAYRFTVPADRFRGDHEGTMFLSQFRPLTVNLMLAL